MQIYVAPMKALAAEVVEKLGKRLAWCGIEVRELTGKVSMHIARISLSFVYVVQELKGRSR